MPRVQLEPSNVPSPMTLDLTFTAEEEAFRAEAGAWLDANVPRESLASFDTRVGFEQHRAWERTLHDAGWAVVSWPVEYGGRGVNLVEWLIFEEEYYRAGAPGRVNQNGIFLLGPTIMEVGTEEQKARFPPTMASSEIVWAQAWSEPNAGSDLAAIRSASGPMMSSAISWMRTSISLQKILLRLASAPMVPPSIMWVTVMYVCSL